MALGDDVDATADIAVDVVVQGEIAIRLIGITPVDQINILALGEQVLDQGTVALQIDHIGPIDQRVGNQQRR